MKYFEKGSEVLSAVIIAGRLPPLFLLVCGVALTWNSKRKIEAVRSPILLKMHLGQALLLLCLWIFSLLGCRKN